MLKIKRAQAAHLLIQLYGPFDRWCGPLLAVRAFAQPAIHADQCVIAGLFEIMARGVSQLFGMGDFAPQSDGELIAGNPKPDEVRPTVRAMEKYRVMSSIWMTWVSTWPGTRKAS